ncbi:hypothetical protein PLANPX_3013 [Lacipirellula parvula]|uniref:KOW domain-containing protein n=1 Tax=Lacipirellula parvula TaxID=2650471 RepID=A0A5K7XEU6_9BACT|nr:hypothetical protein PLANPX_3013 [Lacipirellula parvula]
MGYTIFSVGDVVRIRSGIFAGASGIVASPTVPADLYASSECSRAMLLPVTVEAVVDGEPLTLRIQPESLLKSLPSAPGLGAIRLDVVTCPRLVNQSLS